MHISGGIKKPSWFAAALKVTIKTQDDATKKSSIMKAEIDKITLFWKELKAFEPVLKAEVEGMTCSCHLFTVEKTLADGTHNKYKSLSVLHCNEQDPLQYPDKCSPMVATPSIFTCLSIGAKREYKIAKVDVKGSYLQLKMKGPPVYLQCG